MDPGPCRTGRFRPYQTGHQSAWFNLFFRFLSLAVQKSIELDSNRPQIAHFDRFGPIRVHFGSKPGLLVRQGVCFFFVTKSSRGSQLDRNSRVWKAFFSLSSNPNTRKSRNKCKFKICKYFSFSLSLPSLFFFNL